MMHSIKQTNLGNLFTIFSLRSTFWNCVFPLNKYTESKLGPGSVILSHMKKFFQ